MPKLITPAMRAHLDAKTKRLAAIWRITRKDGAQFFFTDHDRDIVFGSEVYRAGAGFERTAIRSDAGFAVDNLDLVGVFAEGGIVEDEVRAGHFDGAEIAISFVRWDDPDGHGEIRLRRGTLGETRLTPQGYFHAELRGLSQPLAQSTLEVFSPNCRADLGDARRSLDHLSRQEDLTMAWGSDTAATQLSSITTEQFFNQVPTLNPRETAHVQVSVDFAGSPTDHLLVAVYTTLDDSSEVWDIIPMMEFLIENTTDPNRISFLVTGVYKFRVGVRRSGSTDTITSADLSYRKDGVNV